MPGASDSPAEDDDGTRHPQPGVEAERFEPDLAPATDAWPQPVGTSAEREEEEATLPPLSSQAPPEEIPFAPFVEYDSSSEFAGFGPFPREPEPGEVLFGRYRVIRGLGRGGMGSVWLVQHIELESERALKLIVSDIAQNPETRKRFKREARVMAKLRHPNAVTVHDARLAGDVVFIEMEFVAGKSLNQVLTAGHPMPLDWVARILEQLCEVLQSAHEQGIVHRDLKPSNLMLLDGCPAGKEHLKVLDFGIAKILNPDATVVEELPTRTDPGSYTPGPPSAERMSGRAETAADDLQTRPGAVPYSPHYASPEQITSRAVDTRSDLYSLGVIVYEMLTGYRPFQGDQVAYQHVTTEVPAFSQVNPALDLPPDLERVVRWALAKEPEKRPASAREFFEAFQRCLPTPRPAPIAPGFLVLACLLACFLLVPPAEPLKETTPATTPKPLAEGPTLIALGPATPFDRSKHIINSIGMELNLIPAGTFTMGSPNSDKVATGDEKPAHLVRITKPFYLGVREVTQKQYQAVMGENPSFFKGPDDLPVENVSWHDAVAFCEKLTVQEGGRLRYRLPTEAEWEYACRAETTTIHPFSDDSAYLVEHAWYGGNSERRTHPVGQTRANAWGLYDMQGNVTEWCADWYDASYYAASTSVDPSGAAQTPGRVVRGGCWSDSPADCRSASRSRNAPSLQDISLGFRVAAVQE